MVFLSETWKSLGEGTFKPKFVEVNVGFVEAGIYPNFDLS